MKNTIKIFILVSSFSVLFFGCNKKNVTTEFASEDSSNVSSKNVSNKINSPFEPAVTGYENLVAKAKEYEENGKYIYAAGYYFDAMEVASSEEDKNFANENLERISKGLKTGDIGLKTQSVFEIHDTKKSMFFEFYQYFTEFCPFSFSFERFIQKSINFNSHTADFVCDFSSSYSQKFSKLNEMVDEAFYDSQFNEDNAAFYTRYEMEEQWDLMSEAIIQNNYFVSGIAFLHIPYIDTEKLLPTFETSFWCGTDLSLYSYDFLYFPQFNESFNKTFSAPYILDISICDKDGTVLKSIENFISYKESFSQSFDFNGSSREFKYDPKSLGKFDRENLELRFVPEDIMQKFKNDEIFVRIDKVYAPYGNMTIQYGTNISLDEVYKLPKLEVKF